jgi:DNA-binding transcriptional ArsR family regulator
VNTKAVAWAANQELGSTVAKLVLLQLALQVDGSFACLLSVRKLARAASSGQSTVRRALTELERHGLVTRDYQFDESGSQRSSRYLLNHPAAHHLSAPNPIGEPLDLVLPLDLGGATAEARRGQGRNSKARIPQREGVFHQPRKATPKGAS